MRTLSHCLLRISAVFLAIVGTGCANQGASEKTPAADNFPVVEPFSVERAGSRVTVDFELPDSREGARLRPVFIGIRRVSDPLSGSDIQLQQFVRIDEYINQANVPVRLTLTRLQKTAQLQPVMLEQPSYDPGRRPSLTYAPLVEGVSEKRIIATLDSGEALDAGKYQIGKVYHTVELARMQPPTPGRYRLIAESLASHPPLQGGTYEFVVSHHDQKGIE